MRHPLALCSLAVLALALPGASRAAPTVYTSAAAFFAALPGPARVADFDDVSSGEPIAPGGAVDATTFGYDFGGVGLIVTDGTAAGGGAAFDTTSAPTFLGTSDLDVLLDGDDLSLGLDATNAVGLFVVTAETPGVSLFDGDIRLSAAGAEAALDVDDVQATLGDGSLVFFLGVIDPGPAFTSASLGTFGAGGEFAFNVDDVMTALPEPGVAPATAIGLLVLAVARVARRSTSGERPWNA